MKLDAFRRALGDELRRARDARGWTRKDLIDRLGHAVSPQALATYELGTRNCPITRLIEITFVLEESPLDVLGRAYERTYDVTDLRGCEVDLAAVARLDRPELAPLRRWAQSRLRTHTFGQRPTVRLDLTALRLLAELCGLSTADLMNAALNCRPRNDNRAAECWTTRNDAMPDGAGSCALTRRLLDM